MILAGTVITNGGARVEKSGQLLLEDAELRLKGKSLPYVSRAGLKLEAALNHFNMDVQDFICLDVGASTGGFTDCLLRRGALKVYAVDVGHNQLVWSLREDERVVVMEKVNIRTAPPELLPEPVDFICCDVSFISLELVIPAALRYARVGSQAVFLVKPQFEVGKTRVGKGGIVRDETARMEALSKIQKIASEQGFVELESLESPVPGTKGNIEFLLKGTFSGLVS